LDEQPVPAESPGLKAGAIGFLDAVVIGPASRLVLAVLRRLGGRERVFGRSPFEAVHPDVAAGRIVIVETAGLN
jgi:hypothetical protein